MKIKRLSILLLVVLLVFSNILIIYADDTKGMEEIRTRMKTERKEDGMFVDNGTTIDDGIPEVTIDEVSDWVDRKGFEVVGLLQRFIQPFAIVVFIGCAILTLLGAFGNGRLISGGLLGMVISLIIYVAVLYAPEIMDIFLNWVRS